VTSEPPHVRVCPECGEEYRPEIAVCADCGAELVDRRPGQAAPPDPEPQADLEAQLAGRHPVYRGSQVRELIPLAERLREAGISAWIAEQPDRQKEAPPGYLLLVEESATREALAAVADLIAPHDPGADLNAIETRFERDRGYLECPACGSATTPGARECPECGLGLLGEEAAEEPGE
jgi:predicted amidophosphoribosyltransferase